MASGSAFASSQKWSATGAERNGNSERPSTNTQEHRRQSSDALMLAGHGREHSGNGIARRYFPEGFYFLELTQPLASWKCEDFIVARGTNGPYHLVRKFLFESRVVRLHCLSRQLRSPVSRTSGIPSTQRAEPRTIKKFRPDFTRSGTRFFAGPRGSPLLFQYMARSLQ